MERINRRLARPVNLGDDGRCGLLAPTYCTKNQLQVSGGQFDGKIL